MSLLASLRSNSRQTLAESINNATATLQEESDLEPAGDVSRAHMPAARDYPLAVAACQVS